MPLQASKTVNFEEMNALFSQSALSQFDDGVLNAWRPLRRSLWRYMQPIMGFQAACRTEYAQLDDHRICFWQAGSAEETVLLLHGFGSSKENWAFVASKFAHCRIVIPDLPGFGCSDFHFGADYSLAAQAERLADFLEQQDIKKCHVVGSSMGGAIAALLAVNQPEKIASLTLMNAAGVPAERSSLLESSLLDGVNPLAPGSRKDATMVFAICLYKGHRALAAFLSWVLAGEMSHRKPVNDYLFSLLIVSQQHVFNNLKNVSIPTLILWGSEDRVLDVSCVGAFRQQIPHARSRILANIGHLPMLESPGLTAKILKEFWQSLK